MACEQGQQFLQHDVHKHAHISHSLEVGFRTSLCFCGLEREVDFIGDPFFSTKWKKISGYIHVLNWNISSKPPYWLELSFLDFAWVCL